MTTERKIIVVLSSIILLGLCLFGYETHKAYIANVVADVKEQDSKAASLKVDEAIRQRDEAQNKYAKTVLATPVKTAQQAVQVISRYIPIATDLNQPPQLDKPYAIEIAKDDIAPADQAKLPDSSTYVLQTPELTIQTAKRLQQCDVDAHALAACREDFKDSQSQTAIEHQDAMQWKQATKGGSKWTRIWVATKWTITGLAIGSAIGYAAHH